jgi:hypothetical protein
MAFIPVCASVAGTGAGAAAVGGILVFYLPERTEAQISILGVS